MSTITDVLAAFSSHARNGTGMEPAGLFVVGSDKGGLLVAVPLRSRTVDSKVHCDAGFADTTETFQFASHEHVRVVFKFPLPPRSVVYKFEATIGDRTIITEVKPDHEAQQGFNTDVSQEHTAANQDESTQIFTLELGNLEAMQEAIVTISYLGVLDSVGSALEWVHTSTWRPPYLGSAGGQHRGAAAALQQNPRLASQAAYSLTYDIELLSSRGIKAVESPQAVHVWDKAEGGGASKHVVFSEQVSDPSTQITLMVELYALHYGRHAVVTANGYGQASLQRSSRPGRAGTAPTTRTIALATFVPHPVIDPTANVCDAAPPLHLELVLMIDCSYSMRGPIMAQVVEVTLQFIKDLPAGRGVKFNIVVFGSTHAAWSVACQQVTTASRRSAVKWVQAHVQANMGGTNVLGTFRAVYDMPVTPGYARRNVLLSDGTVGRPESLALFQLVTGKPVATNRDQHEADIQWRIDRILGNVDDEEGSPAELNKPPVSSLPMVLCLGIGGGVHRGVLDGMASRTGGVAHYVVGDETIGDKMRLLCNLALEQAPVVCEPQLVTTSGVVRAVPHVLPPRLFPDQPLHMLVELDPSNPATSLKLQGMRADGSKWEIDMPLDKAPVVDGEAYSVLHAMCLVSGLLDETSHLHVSSDGTPLPNEPWSHDVRTSMMSAAVGAHLVTRHTAAVGVMIRKDPLNPTKVTKVEVPLVMPHGADHYKTSKPHDSPPFIHGSSNASPAPGVDMDSGDGQSIVGRNTPVGTSFTTPKGLSALPSYQSHTQPRIKVSMQFSPPPRPPPPPPPPQFHSRSLPQSPPAGAVHVSILQPSILIKHECSEDADGDAEPRWYACGIEPEAHTSLLADYEDGQIGMADGASPLATEQQQQSPENVLKLLSQWQWPRGSWSDSEALLQAVTSQVAGDRQAAVVTAWSGKPSELSGEQWATVLALAFLRKHCPFDSSVWGGMEAKAMNWLGAGWPATVRADTVLLAAATLV